MLFIRSNYNVTSNRDAFLAKIIFAAKFVRVGVLFCCHKNVKTFCICFSISIISDSV